MRPASSTFADTLARSHVAASAVEVLTDGEPVATLDVAAGTVTLDATAQVQGTSDITIPTDGELVPTAATDLLAPYGNEIRISRGLLYPDGTSELVVLGTHRIEQVEVTGDPGDLQVRLTCRDRSARIIDARFEEPFQIAAGTNYQSAIWLIIQAAAPDLAYDLTATARTTPAITALEGDDRWDLVQQMASAIGMRLYFDGDGVLKLRPDNTGAPVATIAEGGVLLSATRSWTRQGAFNRVIATGENSSETGPVRGVATDENTASPTYYYGPFGRVPRFYSSPFITTSAQAEDAARAILQRELGTAQQVQFSTIVDPRLEPGDVVRVTRAASGIDEDHVLDSVTIPLSVDQPMTCTTRKVTT